MYAIFRSILILTADGTDVYQFGEYTALRLIHSCVAVHVQYTYIHTCIIVIMPSHTYSQVHAAADPVKVAGPDPDKISVVIQKQRKDPDAESNNVAPNKKFK